jgi:hypothetical protein
MKVRLAELRQVAEMLFDHLEAEGNDEFDINDDYYWKIPPEQLYDPTKDPTELALEQLTDNWGWLNRGRSGEAAPTAYHLVWLAAFLRWVGERVVR